MERADVELGSVEEVTGRLESWCQRDLQGLVQVEFDQTFAQREVVSRLKSTVARPWVDVDLSAGDSLSSDVPGELMAKLKSAPGGVASITGLDWAFLNRDGMDNLASLSFQREALAALPVLQIWWLPSYRTKDFIVDAPDFDSWFRLRLHLTERLPEGQTIRSTTSVSVEEARSLAARFWKLLEKAKTESVPAVEISAHLAGPAIMALLSAGLEVEAKAISSAVPALTTEPTVPPLEQGRTRETGEGVFEDDSPVARGVDNGLSADLRDVHRDRWLENQYSIPGLFKRRNGSDGKFALKIGETLRTRTARVFGPEHPVTLAAMNNLALSLKNQDRLEDALALQLETLKLSRKVLGDDHRNTLTAMSNLVQTFASRGRFEEATALQAELMGRLERVLGFDHPKTLATEKDLRQMRAQLDQNVDA